MKLRTAWRRVCKAFQEGGFPEPSSAKLVLDEGMHDSPRHYAGCREDGQEVRVAPSLEELPEEIVLGILAHEAGHVVDFLYPDVFDVKRGRLVRTWKPRKQSKHLDEVIADKIAEAAIGGRIGYVRYQGVLLECLGRGTDRPSRLR